MKRKHNIFNFGIFVHGFQENAQHFNIQLKI